MAAQVTRSEQGVGSEQARSGTGKIRVGLWNSQTL